LAVLALCLFLAALAGVAWQYRLRSGAGPAPIWVGGWLVLLASAVSTYASEGAGAPLTHIGGPLLPALLLAGAFLYAESAVPRWLLPAAAAFGLLRWGLASTGHAALGHGLSLGVEPSLSLAAAWLVHRAATRGSVASVPQRLLPPAFVAVALVDALSAIGGLQGQDLPTLPILFAWLAVGGPTLALQISAAGDLARERRRRAEYDRQHLQEALSISEERFRALMENALDLIAEMDAEGRITYANPKYEEKLGAGLGSDPLAWIHPADRERTASWFRTLLGTGSSSPGLARWRQRDGSWRWLESTGRTFRSASGKLQAVVCSRDISDHIRMEEELSHARDELEQRVNERTAKLAEVVVELEQENAARLKVEQRLRASQERYRTVSELSSDLSFAFQVGPGKSLIGEWVTQAFTYITGYTAEEVNARGWHTLAHPDDWEQAREHMYAAAAGSERSFESRIITKQGDVRWLHSHLKGVRSESDGVLRVVGAIRDITEQKCDEEERRRFELHMQEAQKLESLGMLAGGIAHDFNNLLGVIVGSAKLALTEAKSNWVRKQLERIRAAADYATALTDQMLAYAGKASVKLRPLNLTDLVAEMPDLLQASVSKKCRVDFDLADDPPWVKGDLTQMRQVVINLATNAADALEGRTGSISVRTGVVDVDRQELAESFGTPNLEAGRYAFLEVCDSGRGIDTADRTRIFDPFFTTKVSGRGLGLAAVLGIVRQHGGAIQLTSAPGAGATFRVLLPSSSEAGTRVATSLAKREAPRPSSGTILVAEDEEPVLELTSEVLERVGFRVLRARGGQEAVELFRRHVEAIDAVLLDLSMPEVNGHEAMEQIRRVRGDVPVILTSGYNEELTGPAPEDKGLTGFLHKPYDPHDLIERVRSALGH
jgi:PAS domain S-box-containing protein